MSQDGKPPFFSQFCGESRVSQDGKPPFLPAAKPSGPRTVRVGVVGGGGVVGGSSLSGHNITINMKLTTKLRLYEFTLGWDPD